MMRTCGRLALLAFALLVSSCACNAPEHRNDKVCAILHEVEGQIVDCTETAVLVNIGEFKPVVQGLIDKYTGGDGQVDWVSVESKLLSMGIKDGGCILASLAADLANAKKAAMATAPEGPKGAKSAMLLVSKADSYQHGFDDFKKKHYGEVRFRLQVEGKVVLR